MRFLIGVTVSNAILVKRTVVHKKKIKNFVFQKIYFVFKFCLILNFEIKFYFIRFFKYKVRFFIFFVNSFGIKKRYIFLQKYYNIKNKQCNYF